MKRVIASLIFLTAIVAASGAMAHQPDCGPPDHAGPPDDRGGPPGKSTILHCGCADTGDRMEFVEIRISSRSRGHLKHVAGSITSCGSEDSDVFVDFVRNGSDCQLDGPAIGDAMAFCGDQVAGMECGSEVID